MSLLENLANPDYRPPKGPQCGIAIVIQTLGEKDSQTLLTALANPYAPSTRIAQALGEMGHRVSTHVVQRHRRNECRCAE